MNVGEKMPDYLGVDEQGQRLLASEAFPGKALVIYFYPKDSTPGCTAEACSLRDNYSAVMSMGYNIVGVSRDSAKSHERFTQKYELPFRLTTDADNEVAKAFGAWNGEKPVRMTFVADPQHIITAIITKVDTKKAGEQLLQVLGQSPAVGLSEAYDQVPPWEKPGIQEE